MNGIECCGKREKEKRDFSLDGCRVWNGRSSEYLQDMGEKQKRGNEQVSEVFAGYHPEIKKYFPSMGQESRGANKG